jgi:biopolymer transport protein ExbB/TolQ
MADTIEAEKVLLEQAKALDLKVDKRWSVDTLAEKVLEAQNEQRDAKAADFHAKADVWVKLLRAAFPVEDERYEIGATVKVTQDMADRWYAAGVAIPGKAPLNG